MFGSGRRLKLFEVGHVWRPDAPQEAHHGVVFAVRFARPPQRRPALQRRGPHVGARLDELLQEKAPRNSKKGSQEAEEGTR